MDHCAGDEDLKATAHSTARIVDVMLIFSHERVGLPLFAPAAPMGQSPSSIRATTGERPGGIQSQPRVVAARSRVAATAGSPSIRCGTEPGSRRLPSR